VATDTFQPDQGSGPAAGPIVTSLGLITDETTGFVTGISGIGTDGVSVVTGSGGLSATTAGNELVIRWPSSILREPSTPCR